MIKIDFDGKVKDGGFNSSLKYTHKDCTTLEVEFLIAHLINLIKKNDVHMRDNQIIKDVKSILKEMNNEKRGERNNDK